MDGLAHYRQSRELPNRRGGRRIRHLGGWLSPMEQYGEEHFRQRFRLRKDLVISLDNILVKRAQALQKRKMTDTLANARSTNGLWIFSDECGQSSSQADPFSNNHQHYHMITIAIITTTISNTYLSQSLSLFQCHGCIYVWQQICCYHRTCNQPPSLYSHWDSINATVGVLIEVNGCYCLMQ